MNRLAADVDTFLHTEMGKKGMKRKTLTPELVHRMDAYWRAAKRTEGLDAKRFNEMVNFALFCHNVKRWIGALAVALGWLNTLVFAGGIGENTSAVRVIRTDEELMIARPAYPRIWTWHRQ